MNARPLALHGWQPSLDERLRAHSQCFADTFNFADFNLNPALSLASGLKVVNGNRFSTQDQHPPIRLPQPIVKARRTDSQTTGCFAGGTKVIAGHKTVARI